MPHSAYAMNAQYESFAPAFNGEITKRSQMPQCLTEIDFPGASTALVVILADEI